MSETTRVTDGGQTTIPGKFRERYGIEPGDEVGWTDSEGGLVVKKRTALGGCGSFAGGVEASGLERVAGALERNLYQSHRTEWSVK